jgi:hypothetical protein
VGGLWVKNCLSNDDYIGEPPLPGRLRMDMPHIRKLPRSLVEIVKLMKLSISDTDRI